MATDHLTKLQDSLDQLATQMFASLRYIAAHHSLSEIPNQPFHGVPEPGASQATANHAESGDAVASQAQNAPTQQSQQSQTQTQTQTQNQTQADDLDAGDPDFRPDTPRTFAAALEELASDLVSKERQIEALIGSLPGRGRSREEQEARLAELDAELRGVESEVAGARRERDELTRRVEEVMWRIKRW